MGCTCGFADWSWYDILTKNVLLCIEMTKIFHIFLQGFTPEFDNQTLAVLRVVVDSYDI